MPVLRLRRPSPSAAVYTAGASYLPTEWILDGSLWGVICPMCFSNKVLRSLKAFLHRLRPSSVSGCCLSGGSSGQQGACVFENVPRSVSTLHFPSERRFQSALGSGWQGATAQGDRRPARPTSRLDQDRKVCLVPVARSQAKTTRWHQKLVSVFLKYRGL